MTDKVRHMTTKKKTKKKSKHVIARKKGDKGYPTELAEMLGF